MKTVLPQSEEDRQRQLEAAQAKRARKNAKRLKVSGNAQGYERRDMRPKA